MDVLEGIMQTSEPRRSVREVIWLKPESGISGPMKSIVTESPQASGIGKGCNGPQGFDVADLFCWQSTHPGTYDVSSSFLMLGQ